MRKSENAPVTARKALLFLGPQVFGPQQAHQNNVKEKAAIEAVCAALTLATFVLACRIFSLL